jgi:hypothetical protein
MPGSKQVTGPRVRFRAVDLGGWFLVTPLVFLRFNRLMKSATRAGYRKKIN